MAERKGRAIKSVRHQSTERIVEKESNGEGVKCGAR
jgi:hypothetical protein